MKQLIPSRFRVKLKVFQRFISDLISGRLTQFSTQVDSINSQYKPQFSITQTLGSMSAHQLDSKRHNLQLAINKIQNVSILPGQFFSFWHLVGNPNKAAGYVEGRTIQGDQIATTFGGGLCQLSGLLYFLSLKAALKIVERHPHSKDIYTDTTRFAPLGSDATVVYGYKDLRFENTLDVALCFRIETNESNIYATLCSPQSITEFNLEFRTAPCPVGLKVETLRYGIDPTKLEWISSSTYPKLNIPTNLT